MHNFPNIHNQPLSPRKWLYSVIVYGKNGFILAGGAIERTREIQSSLDYERACSAALKDLGVKDDGVVTVLNLISNPNVTEPKYRW